MTNRAPRNQNAPKGSLPASDHGRWYPRGMHPCARGAAGNGNLPSSVHLIRQFHLAASVAQKNITSDMNKHERQGRQPADHTTLTDEIAGELSHITTEVIDVSDSPPIAPRAPLTQDEVRTILMSLLLTMFLAALDQTIVATALPTIGRQLRFATFHG